MLGQEASEDNLGCLFNLLLKSLIEAILMSTYNIHFHDKIEKIPLEYP